MKREDLQDLVVESLKRLGGRGKIAVIAKDIYKHHETGLKESGDLFYTWQYDMRWAAKVLRDNGILAPAGSNRNGIWELNK